MEVCKARRRVIPILQKVYRTDGGGVTVSETSEGGSGALAGRVAVVTGAAGGLGSALTQVLARRGAHVVACDIDEEGLARLSEAGAVTPLPMDLSRPESVQRGVAVILQTHGGADILVHAAIRHIPTDAEHEPRAFADHSPAQVLETLSVSVVGPTLLTQILCPSMIARRWGRIVFTGSMHRTGTPGLAMYSAAKAYLNALARGLFLELREHNVTAAVTNPGGMNTGLHGRRFPWMLDPAAVANSLSRTWRCPRRSPS